MESVIITKYSIVSITQAFFSAFVHDNTSPFLNYLLNPFHLPSTHWRICAYVPGWAEVNFAPVLTNFALFVSLIEFDMLSGFSPTLTLNQIRQCLHLLIIRITIISFRNGEMLL